MTMSDEHPWNVGGLHKPDPEYDEFDDEWNEFNDEDYDGALETDFVSERSAENDAEYQRNYHQRTGRLVSPGMVDLGPSERGAQYRPSRITAWRRWHIPATP